MTATEIPKPLFDFGVRRKLDIQRYGNQVVRAVLALLNESEKDIMARISARGEDGTMTAVRQKALFLEIGQMNYDAHLEAGKQTAKEMRDFADYESEVTAASIQSQVPIHFSTSRPSTAQLAAIVDKTPVTVGPDKKLLLEEIFSSLAAGKEERIRGAVRLGLVEGQSIPDIVRRLRGTRAARYTDGILEVDRRGAAAMVRTIVNHTSNGAVQRTYSENADLVKGWTFLATLDSHTSLTCRSLSGTTWPVGKGPVPPRHPRCRSFSVPRIATWRELGVDLDEMPPSTRASKDGPVKADISMDEWIRTQSAADIKAMLGASRAKLFTEGKLDIKAFTDDKGVAYTLAELKTRHAVLFKEIFGE